MNPAAGNGNNIGIYPVYILGIVRVFREFHCNLSHMVDITL